jgi:hypothetical protein
MSKPRPVLLGFQRIQETSPDRVENDLRVLKRLLIVRGTPWVLFSPQPQGSAGAWERLLASVRGGEAAAVGVPSEADLGGTARERTYLRAQLRDAGVRLLVGPGPVIDRVSAPAGAALAGQPIPGRLRSLASGPLTPGCPCLEHLPTIPRNPL